MCIRDRSYDRKFQINTYLLTYLLCKYEYAWCSYQADDGAAAAGAGAGYDSGPTAPVRRHLPSVDEVDYDDTAPRTASRLASGAGSPGYGLDSPTRSGSPPIVALNETGRGPSRIGATLYQAPSPHSGFTATQNVVSSSAVRPVDVDQVGVLTQYIEEGHSI